jgi:hypothetical protein
MFPTRLLETQRAATHPRGWHSTYPAPLTPPVTQWSRQIVQTGPSRLLCGPLNLFWRKFSFRPDFSVVTLVCAQLKQGSLSLSFLTNMCVRLKEILIHDFIPACLCPFKKGNSAYLITSMFVWQVYIITPVYRLTLKLLGFLWLTTDIQCHVILCHSVCGWLKEGTLG